MYGADRAKTGPVATPQNYISHVCSNLWVHITRELSRFGIVVRRRRASFLNFRTFAPFIWSVVVSATSVRTSF